MVSLQLIRALDAIVIGLVAALIFVPQLLSEPVLASGRGLVYTAPVMLLAYISFRIPRRFQQIPEWDRIVLGLRAFGLAWAGFSPLVVWWLSSQTALYPAPGNPDTVVLVRNYFAVNAVLAVLAGTGWLMHVNWLVQRLARFCEIPGLELEAAMNRWLLLIGTMCLTLVALVAVIIMDVPPVELVQDYVQHWGRTVVFILLLPCLPVLMVTTLVIRVRYGLNTHIESQFERYSLDELAHRSRVAEQQAGAAPITPITDTTDSSPEAAGESAAGHTPSTRRDLEP